jgi:hypothetical protein
MRTLKTLKPGQKGTKELLTRYGTSLLCVRYRYDETTGERVKTVELIVRRYSRDCARARPPVRQVGSRIRVASGDPAAAGTPAAPRVARSAGRTTVRKVGLRIHFREADLRRRVKSAGGRWDPERAGSGSCGATRPSATACFIAWWRGRWMDVDAGWLDLGTSRVAKCGRGVGG